jgi:hypothetical protein
LKEIISERTGSAAFVLIYNRKFNGFKDFSRIISTKIGIKHLKI